MDSSIITTSLNLERSNTMENVHTSWTPPQNRNMNTLPSISNGGLALPSESQNGFQETSITSTLDTYDKQYLPSQPKSLSGIATRAFLLGIVLALSTTLSLFLLMKTSSPLWRVSSFFAVLSFFHFLEFWTTAHYNTRSAEVSSFLLSQNGKAYNIAHATAFLECLLTNTIPIINYHVLPPAPRNTILILGLALIIIGQTVRSVAMISAGTNFNHIVQHTKSQSHQLVTTGIYGYLRHPSYFGFFWWGLGTQLMLGNLLCFLAYAVVLWRFFSRRISGEEELLVQFFGEKYVKYRQSTSVGIPFIL
jgi:protein-S-isoprenylcysteine O-methyltransferase